MPASRSLIALLVGTVAFFALWTFALKGNSSSTGGGSSKGGLGQYHSDINAAHQAVAESNASNAAAGNENAASTPTSSTTAHSTAEPTAKPSTNPLVTTTKAQRHSARVSVSAVEAAVHSHKVVALLFYNPLAADDRAVSQELRSVPTHKGAVVKLAVPLNEAASFTAVTQLVPLNFSPTLVLISKSDQASEIVGYTDSFEIDQRVDDALTAS